jgi:hypothetical protein
VELGLEQWAGHDHLIAEAMNIRQDNGSAE